jgi:hypothetical protein
VGARLDILDDFLLIRAGHDEADIILVLVHVIAKYLLILLIHIIHVVNDNHLLAAEYARLRFAKGVHLVAEKMDALLLEVINMHDILMRDDIIRSVVFAYHGAEEGGLARVGVAYEEHIELVHVAQHGESPFCAIVEEKVVEYEGLVLCHKGRLVGTIMRMHQ